MQVQMVPKKVLNKLNQKFIECLTDQKSLYGMFVLPPKHKPATCP